MADHRPIKWKSARPDLSRLPKGLREQLGPSPMGENEIRSSVTIFQNPDFKGLSHPTGRTQISAHLPDPEKVDEYEGLSINFTDFKGIFPLVCVTFSLKQAKILFKGYIKEYKRSGGNLEELKETLEEMINERETDTDDSDSGYDM